MDGTLPTNHCQRTTFQNLTAALSTRRRGCPSPRPNRSYARIGIDTPPKKIRKFRNVKCNQLHRLRMPSMQISHPTIMLQNPVIIPRGLAISLETTFICFSTRRQNRFQTTLQTSGRNRNNYFISTRFPVAAAEVKKQSFRTRKIDILCTTTLTFGN